MSGLATSHSTSSKRARNSNGTTNDGSAVISGSATPSKPTGTTANEVKTTSPLNAALAEMKEGIESLPTVSQPLLHAQASKIIRLGVDHYHYGKRLAEAKSNPNYVSTSVKGINFELQVDADAQDGEAFKTIRNELTAALEECRVQMTHKFVLPAQELTLEAKGKRYLAEICTYVHQLVSMYIAQGGTKDYDAHQAVMDLFYVKFDELLVPFAMKPCDFLPIYKTMHKLQQLPMPKVGAGAGNTRPTKMEVLLHRLNGTSLGASSSSSSSQATCTTLTLVDDTASPADQTDDTQPSSENDVDMEDIAQAYRNDIVGGRMYVLRQTWMAIQGTLHDAIIKFNDQAKTNDEALRIKKALTPITMSQSAARVSTLLNKEAPVAPPILRGLIQEESTNVTAKTLEQLQRRLQSTEDKLSAMTKSKKAGGGGTKTKNTPRTGTPIAANSNAQSKTTPKKSSKKKSEQQSNKSSSKKKSNKSKSRRDRDANSNATTSDSRRSNGNKQQVSFSVRKNTTRIFSPK